MFQKYKTIKYIFLLFKVLFRKHWIAPTNGEEYTNWTTCYNATVFGVFLFCSGLVKSDELADNHDWRLLEAFLY